MALTSPSSCYPLSLTVPPVHCPTYASPFSGFLLSPRSWRPPKSMPRIHQSTDQ